MVLRDIASGDMRQFRRIVQKADHLNCDGLVLPFGTMGAYEIIQDDPPGPLEHYDRAGGTWVERAEPAHPESPTSVIDAAAVGEVLDDVGVVLYEMRAGLRRKAGSFAEFLAALDEYKTKGEKK